MTTRLAVIVAAVAGICCAMPAGAEEVGVGVGPVGVTVGSGHRDWDRDHDRGCFLADGRAGEARSSGHPIREWRFRNRS